MEQNYEASASGYLSDSFEGISRKFTDIEVMPTPGHNLVARAKRYGRWWVLKGLKPEVAHNETYRHALRKELEMMLMMQHSNVVQATGLERLPSMGDCIVMEYVDGQTLREWLAEGQHSIEQRLRVATQLVEAVAYIHRAGVVHRDLKPENILITRNGDNVKLIDFGLADTDSHATLKQPAGTRSYMSPEQAQVAVPDVRNDIYSLGVILDEMDLGRGYRKVVQHCLLPMERRYQNAEELLAALKELQGKRFSSPTGWTIWAIGAVLLAAVVLLTVNNLQLRHSMDRLDDVREDALKALQEKIDRTEVDKHIDTLSSPQYQWADLSERVLNVNNFIYDYTERLAEQLEPKDVESIRAAMLDEWQRWSENVSAALNDPDKLKGELLFLRDSILDPTNTDSQ